MKRNSIIALLVAFACLVLLAQAQQLSSFEGNWQLDITVDQQNYTTNVWICADQLNNTLIWGAYGLANAPRGFFSANIVNTSNAVGPAHQVFSEAPGFVTLNIDTFNGQDILFFSVSFDNVNGQPFDFNATGSRVLANNTSGDNSNANNMFRDLCLYTNNTISFNDYQGFWQSFANETNTTSNAGDNSLLVTSTPGEITASNVSICMNENITSIENAQIVVMNMASTGPQEGSLNGTIFDLFRVLGFRIFGTDARYGQILFLRDSRNMLGWWWRSEDEFGGRDHFIKSSTMQVLLNGTQCIP